jgi:hypothetical protein
VDREYADSPHYFVKAFFLLQEDIKSLFNYIEPSDINLPTFSFKIHELLIRTCLEIEANFKAILRENIYTPVFKRGKKEGQAKTEDLWNMKDYIKINETHHLDNYEVELPFWRGEKNQYKPFENWSNSNSLKWYQAYNETKHDRHKNFETANFENLIKAFCGLFVVLSSQFHCESFSTGGSVLEINVDSYFEGEFGIGDYLKIKFPANWQDDEKYDFDWSVLIKEEDRFEKIDYNSI